MIVFVGFIDLVSPLTFFKVIIVEGPLLLHNLSSQSIINEVITPTINTLMDIKHLSKPTMEIIIWKIIISLFISNTNLIPKYFHIWLPIYTRDPTTNGARRN